MHCTVVMVSMKSFGLFCIFVLICTRGTKKMGHYHIREPFRPLLKRDFKIAKGQILIYFQLNGIKT